MALKLVLKAGERIAINGAVITNGDRRSTLMVENLARVLRESDIIQPDEVTTPASHIYFAVMMLYLDPIENAQYATEYEHRLIEFTSVVTDPAALTDCVRLTASVSNGDYYNALNICRRLMEFEETRLNHVA